MDLRATELKPQHEARFLSRVIKRGGPEAILATKVMRTSFATVEPTTLLIDAASLLL
jgi:hypothetical protein